MTAIDRESIAWHAYLPYRLAQVLAATPDAEIQQFAERVRAVALFADVSGFSALGEAFALPGTGGAEGLMTVLDRSFAPLIALIESYGGVIGRFSVDAISAYFPFGQERSTTIERATSCAVAMQALIDGETAIITQASSFVPAIRIGLGEGHIVLITLGDRTHGLEYMVAGSALDLAALAQRHAERGEIVVHRSLTDALGSAMLIARRSPESGRRTERERRIRRTGYGNRVRHRGRGRRNAEHPARYFVLSAYPGVTELAPFSAVPDYSSAAIEQVQRFLHPAIVERLANGQHNMLDEHRSVWALFAAFEGFDFEQDAAIAEPLRHYVAQVQAITARYDGTLNKIDVGDTGPTFTVLFGAPVAHTDDAQRAIHCALDLRSLDPQLRIGLAGGFAYCGLIGSRTRREYSAIGDALNLAARLMQIADSGQILVSEPLWRMVEHGFSWQQPRLLHIKGRSSMVTAHALDKRRDQVERVLVADTPLLGRSAELRWLAARLARAGAGHGQIVLLSGEAGIGKTRLIAALAESAYRREARVVHGAALSYRSNSSYLIWHSVFRELLDLNATLSSEAQIAQIEAQLRSLDPQLLARMPLLSAALNLSIADNALTAALDPRLRKTALETLIGELLRSYAAAQRRPLVIVLDDAHWMDMLSRSLLEVLARSILALPILIIVAYRPYEGEAPPALRLPHVSALHLDELGDAASIEYVINKYRQIFHGASPSPELAQQIGRVARGNPFFIGELLNLLHDQGRTDVTALDRVELPQSLHSLVLSRLDRLTDETRTALKVASVIGQQFPAHWLQAILPQHSELPQLIEQLEALCRDDLTAMAANGPLPLYTFRHSATRDVAYESLALATRAMLHERTGTFIEHTYATEIERYLDLLAYHYGLSANVAKQREFFARAGEAAQAAYANEAAISYYERLIPLLTSDEQPTFLLRLAEVQRLVGGWDIAEQLYQRTLTLSDEPAIHARCLRNLGELCRERGNFVEAHRWLADALTTARVLGDRLAIAQTLQQIGSTLLGQGELLAALDQMEQARALIEDLENPRALAQVLNNAGLVH
jgi:class 3 adenylate cyclase/tetratricopeptide (TPR) repeat protein